MIEDVKGGKYEVDKVHLGKIREFLETWVQAIRKLPKRRWLDPWRRNLVSSLHFNVAPQQYLPIMIDSDPFLIDLNLISADWNLLELLRACGYTAPKNGCGEGGCGACVVVVTERSSCGMKLVHRSANSCILHCLSVFGCHVMTARGCGNGKQLNSFQKLLIDRHGSQCGYCIPGFVASVAHAELNEYEDAVEALDSNLCRCTGYIGILDALSDLKVGENSYPPIQLYKDLELPSPRCVNLSINISGPRRGGQGILHFAAPHNIDDLESVLKMWKGTKFRILGGHSERTIEYLLGFEVCWGDDQRRLLSTTGIDSLRSVLDLSYNNFEDKRILDKLQGLLPESDTGFLFIGSAVSISQFADYCKERVDSHSLFRAYAKQMSYFANTSIRNYATVVGNLVAATPVSDLLAVHCVANVSVFYLHFEGTTTKFGIRRISENFFMPGRKVDLPYGFCVIGLLIEKPDPNDYFHAVKFSRRTDDDICIVSAASRITTDVKWNVTSSGIGLSGMNWRVIYIPNPLTTGPIVSSQICRSLFYVPPGSPGGMEQYRTRLCRVSVFRALESLKKKLDLYTLEPLFEDWGLFSTPEIKRGNRPRTGMITDQGSVGESVEHLASKWAVAGEAEFLEDENQTKDCLFTFPVLSTVACGRIVDLNIDEVLVRQVAPTYVMTIVASDVAVNACGVTVMDEEILASELVQYHGQPIALVVAVDRNDAREAARAIQNNVTYESYKAILEMEEAISSENFLDPGANLRFERDYEDKNWVEFAKTYRRDDNPNGRFVFVDGECETGDQQHFYFETQRAYAEVKNDGIYVKSSTQDPAGTAFWIARMLDKGLNEVTVENVRVGGAFGGKESQANWIGCLAALGAEYQPGKRVYCILDRQTDFVVTGGRHPVKSEWTIVWDRIDKRVVFFKCIGYLNCGYSMDLSTSVAERYLFSLENAYRLTSAGLDLRVKLCKTNRASNTAFRGFGGPQGMVVAECVIDALAGRLELQSEALRKELILRDGDVNQYGWTVSDSGISAMYEALYPDFVSAKESADKFNKKHILLKRGVALIATKYGCSFTKAFMNQSSASVHIRRDGSVLVQCGGIEMGQGLQTKLGQIASQALGIPMKLIKIDISSTRTINNGQPTAASMGTDMNGIPLREACELLKSRIIEAGWCIHKDNWKQIIEKMYFLRINLSEHAFHTSDVGYSWEKGGNPFLYHGNGVCLAEVEVDVTSGIWSITNLKLQQDVGNSINPGIDIGQVEGAFAQGLGWLTIEEFIRNPDGSALSTGPAFYKIPGMHDVPKKFCVTLLPRANNQPSIYGAKAVGEPPLFLGYSPVAAIIDAVRQFRMTVPGLKDSTRWFPKRFPLTRERIALGCPIGHILPISAS